LLKQYDNLKNESDQEKNEIIKIWLTGNRSSTLIIPRKLATEYGLDEPGHALIKGTPDGLLIRKLSF
jgi:hypothetical protein